VHVLLIYTPFVQVGLGVAVQQVIHIGIQNIWEAISQIACYARKGLMELEGVTVQDRGATLCGIVSFTVVCLPSPS
jgi:cysteine desulfurase / selenocysteine lyase